VQEVGHLGVGCEEMVVPLLLVSSVRRMQKDRALGG